MGGAKEARAKRRDRLTMQHATVVPREKSNRGRLVAFGALTLVEIFLISYAFNFPTGLPEWINPVTLAKASAQAALVALAVLVLISWPAREGSRTPGPRQCRITTGVPASSLTSHCSPCFSPLPWLSPNWWRGPRARPGTGSLYIVFCSLQLLRRLPLSLHRSVSGEASCAICPRRSQRRRSAASSSSWPAGSRWRAGAASPVGPSMQRIGY